MNESNPVVGEFSMDEALRQMGELEGLEQVSMPYVRFRAGLLKIQREALDGVDMRGGEGSGNGQKTAPPLSAGDVEFDAGRIEAMLGGLLELLGDPARSDQEAPRLCRRLAESPADARELAERAAFALGAEEMLAISERLEAEEGVAVFMGRALAAPFVHAAAARRRDFGEAEFRLGHCGICSAEPGMSMLEREGGRRFLYCSLCGARGASKRLVCPFCGHSDVGALSYVRVEESDARWIEACEKCGRYLKTVDERKIQAGRPFIPVAEDAATLHLDMLAEREGCRRNWPYAACV